MLIVVLAIVWIAVLAPILIRRFRDQDTDRSIVNFHERMARLGTGTPLVEPAHRLAVNDESPARELLEHETSLAPRAPRLRIVPSDATPGQLERDQSWDEWSRAYSDDPFEPASPSRHQAPSGNYRAAAYSRVPAQKVSAAAPSSPYGSRSQRVRRRRVLFTLSASTALSTFSVLLSGALIVELWALGSWVMLLSFLGLMYYAMSIGMLGGAPQPSTRLVNPRVASVPAITYNEFDLAYEPHESQWTVLNPNSTFAEAR